MGVGKRGEEISLSKCTARREVSGNEEILLFVTGYMYSSILKKQSGDKLIHSYYYQKRRKLAESF